MGLPEWIPCKCMNGRGQGMVLEEGLSDPSGESLPDIPLTPTWRYRCQDCPETLVVLVDGEQP